VYAIPSVAAAVGISIRATQKLCLDRPPSEVGYGLRSSHSRNVARSCESAKEDNIAKPRTINVMVIIPAAASEEILTEWERSGGKAEGMKLEVAPRIRGSVKLTYDYDSSNVRPCLRKRTARNSGRMPSSEVWIVSAERN
jgi:hypothetical protein